MVSRLLRGSFRDYSVERLLRLLTILGHDVEIVVRKSAARLGGRLSVEAALCDGPVLPEARV